MPGRFTDTCRGFLVPATPATGRNPAAWLSRGPPLLTHTSEPQRRGRNTGNPRPRLPQLACPGPVLHACRRAWPSMMRPAHGHPRGRRGQWRRPVVTSRPATCSESFPYSLNAAKQAGGGRCLSAALACAGSARTGRRAPLAGRSRAPDDRGTKDARPGGHGGRRQDADPPRYARRRGRVLGSTDLPRARPLAPCGIVEACVSSDRAPRLSAPASGPTTGWATRRDATACR